MPEANQTLTAEEVASPPLVETPNPNDTGERNPGDPTISLNPDGTPANAAAKMSMTVTPNPNPTPQSDPAFVPSPHQQAASASGTSTSTTAPASTAEPKVPILASISPESAFANHDLELTVSGTDFDSGAKVVFAGIEAPTSALDQGTLKATIPAGQIPNPGTFQVSVKNFNGTVSNEVTFTAT